LDLDFTIFDMNRFRFSGIYTIAYGFSQQI